MSWIAMQKLESGISLLINGKIQNRNHKWTLFPTGKKKMQFVAPANRNIISRQIATFVPQVLPRWACSIANLDFQMSINKCSKWSLFVLPKSARAANKENKEHVQFSKMRSCALCALLCGIARSECGLERTLGMHKNCAFDTDCSFIQKTLDS